MQVNGLAEDSPFVNDSECKTPRPTKGLNLPTKRVASANYPVQDATVKDLTPSKPGSSLRPVGEPFSKYNRKHSLDALLDSEDFGSDGFTSVGSWADDVSEMTDLCSPLHDKGASQTAYNKPIIRRKLDLPSSEQKTSQQADNYESFRDQNQTGRETKDQISKHRVPFVYTATTASNSVDDGLDSELVKKKTDWLSFPIIETLSEKILEGTTPKTPKRTSRIGRAPETPGAQTYQTVRTDAAAVTESFKNLMSPLASCFACKAKPESENEFAFSSATPRRTRPQRFERDDWEDESVLRPIPSWVIIS